MYHTIYMHDVFLSIYIIIIPGFHIRPPRTIIVLQEDPRNVMTNQIHLQRSNHKQLCSLNNVTT